MPDSAGPRTVEFSGLTGESFRDRLEGRTIPETRHGGVGGCHLGHHRRRLSGLSEPSILCAMLWIPGRPWSPAEDGVTVARAYPDESQARVAVVLDPLGQVELPASTARVQAADFQDLDLIELKRRSTATRRSPWNGLITGLDAAPRLPPNRLESHRNPYPRESHSNSGLSR